MHDIRVWLYLQWWWNDIGHTARTCFQNCHSCPSSQNTSQLAKTEKSKEWSKTWGKKQSNVVKISGVFTWAREAPMCSSRHCDRMEISHTNRCLFRKGKNAWEHVWIFFAESKTYLVTGMIISTDAKCLHTYYFTIPHWISFQSPYFPILFSFWPISKLSVIYWILHDPNRE